MKCPKTFRQLILVAIIIIIRLPIITRAIKPSEDRILRSRKIKKKRNSILRNFTARRTQRFPR